MVPVSPGTRRLFQTYGVGQHMTAYFNPEDPSRIYVNANGRLCFIDLSMLKLTNGIVKQCGVEMLPVIEIGGDMGKGVQNSVLNAFAKNDPLVQNDLECELNKVVARVLSKVAEKHNKNEVSRATESSKCTNVSKWQTLTDSERGQLQRERRKKSAYKTSLCKTFRENKACPYGEECVFAHGESELRLPPQAHPKYKTKLCNKFSLWNCCPYGARCQFIHQRVNETLKFHTKGNAGNHLSEPLQHLSKRLITKGSDKSIELTNFSATLGSHPSFDGQGGLSASSTSTDFSYKQPAQKSGLFGVSCTDQDDSRLYGKMENTFLNQLYDHFNNTKIEDHENTFSRSCFSRIISC